jgi:NitT/TauT family transport system permease protein
VFLCRISGLFMRAAAQAEPGEREWLAAVRNLSGPIGFALSLFLVWEIGCVWFDVSPFALPRPSRIVHVMVAQWFVIAPHLAQTAASTVTGFTLGVALGFSLGVIIGASRTVQRMSYPSLIGFNAIPKVAFVPVLALWFGTGFVPAVLTAMLICLFPVLVIVSTSIASVAPELNDVLRSLGARGRDVLLKVGIPQCMPYFFGSLKIAITLAFVGTVTSETVAANAGIGYLMIRAASDFDIVLVFASLMWLVVLGVVSYAICVFLEKIFANWAFRADERP